MSFQRIMTLVAVGWSLTIIALGAVRVSMLSPSPGLAESLGWLFVATAPVGVLLAIVRGPVTSVAQVLYNTEQQGSRVKARDDAKR